MNVLLVPAHPGFPGQIPQSRKTVVVVVVRYAMWSLNTYCILLCRGSFVNVHLYEMFEFESFNFIALSALPSLHPVPVCMTVTEKKILFATTINGELPYSS